MTPVVEPASAGIETLTSPQRFADAALVFELPTTVLLRSCGFLVITAATSAMAAWQIERQSRRSFLECALAGGAAAGTANLTIMKDAFAQTSKPLVIGRKP